jgi:hypothetical protein
VPDSALSVGPRLRALAVYLVVFQHVPVERCQQLIAEVTGAAVSAGFVHSCLRQTASLAAEVVRLIRILITAAAVAGFDETTLRSGPAGAEKYVHGAFTGHSDFSGIGHLDLPAPPSPAMRAVTMRTGALRRLELMTRIPGHASIAAAARALYGRRGSALQQQLSKIEKAAGFPIIDRSSTPLAPADGGREFIREALPILQAAREQTPHPRRGLEDAEVSCGHAENPSAVGLTPPAI